MKFDLPQRGVSLPPLGQWGDASARAAGRCGWSAQDLELPSGFIQRLLLLLRVKLVNGQGSNWPLQRRSLHLQHCGWIVDNPGKRRG